MTSRPATTRRRRRWPWVLATVVVVLVVVLVVADRVAVSVAQRAVARKLADQAGFASPPSVRAEGFPFLTQAVAGDYRHIAVSGSGLTLGGLTGVRFDADLTGVHVPLSAVLHQSVDRVPVDRASGTFVVPYASFAAQTGIKGLTITASGGTLTVTAPVPIDVAFLHETLQVVADGRVAAVDGQLELTVDHIRVAGISLPGIAVNAVSDALNSRVSLGRLPYGLTLQSVSAHDDGLHVAVGGRDLVVSAG